MQKYILVVVMLAMIALSGCSLEDKLTDLATTIVRQDQQHEQGFVVDRATLYARYDENTGTIDLHDQGLLTIPDLCTLLDATDQPQIRRLDLSHNRIRLVQTDLSCLTQLTVLDLSHNQIKTVQTLGDLPSLRELNMEHNALTTTADFPDLPALEKLNLAFNKLKEVKDLDDLKNLVSLELQQNMIERIVGVDRLKHLQKLKLDFDKVKAGDLTPIFERLEGTQLVDQLGNVLSDKLKEDLLKNLPF